MSKKQNVDFLFQGGIANMDPVVQRLIDLEEERQVRKLIMIASESTAPLAVREALGSVYTNLYAEGYPSPKMYADTEEQLNEHNHQLSYLRRYADRRYYKGVENADFIEALARRRCAEAFAANGVTPDKIFVNVQPLSGAAANNAVYQAFTCNGDTVMGLDLAHGGHLTHGSPVNRTGMSYNIVTYKTNPQTGMLDYDEIAKLAKEYKPRMIIAGYSAYPRTIDWAKFREIADSVGATLLADISHPAGLVATGEFPSPVGYAHVTSFTTHKTLCGPRGACILTTTAENAAFVDSAVFPGEQGGPHMNNIAAKAIAFRIAQSDEFKHLQKAVKANAQALTEAFIAEDLDIAYGGTDSHITLVNLRKFKGLDGAPLRAEVPSRILDMCGLTCNKNSIFDDEVPSYPSGLRFGTTWVTQRGLGKDHMKAIAKVVAKMLKNITPFDYYGLRGILGRGKMQLKVLEEIKRDIAAIAADAKADIDLATGSEYPYYTPIEVKAGKPTVLAAANKKAGAKTAEVGGWEIAMSYGDTKKEVETAKKDAVLVDMTGFSTISISGLRANNFMAQICTKNTYAMKPGDALHTFILDDECKLIDDVAVTRNPKDSQGRDNYTIIGHPENAERLLMWLRGLADGYILFDKDDVTGKVEGPVVIEDLSSCLDTEARRAVIALYGPKAAEKLGKAGNIEAGKVACGKDNGIPAAIAHFECPAAEQAFYIISHVDKTEEIWNKLIDAGVTPAGKAALDEMRKGIGAPDYSTDARPTGVELYKQVPDKFDLFKFYFVGQKEIVAAAKPKADKTKFVWKEVEGEIQYTTLHAEHLKLTSKAFMVPFAGWEMPVWYSSVGEEHNVVRTASALFDVSHMGVLGFDGEYAPRFLDMVTTNYVFWLEPGQSHYSYILGPDGDIIDDCMVYCIARDRYLMVVNASNADKVIAWFNAVISGDALLDNDNPTKKLEAEFTFRNLKDTKVSGKDSRIDIALQGPNSLKILQALTDDPEKIDRLARIPRTGLIEIEIGGMNMIVSRTGYTGEEIAFEIFVHPDNSVKFWNLILEKGKPFGVAPAGLGSRDTTRTEAGLPLYGHELEGEFGITPFGAGYPAYVKLHKPFFIGKKPMVDKETKRTREIVRWQMNNKGVKSVHNGDPVVNKRGQYIGKVTSACLVEGYQLGLAYIDRKYLDEGTQLGIFAIPHDKMKPEPAKNELDKGDKLYLHDWATVISRFPERPTGLPQARAKKAAEKQAKQNN